MTAGTRVVVDGGMVAWRNLLTLTRTPGAIVNCVVQPVLFVMLFAYVFGGSLGGDSYREFLIGGVLAQTVTFNAAFTVVGLADDLQRGIVDRFRSLPMSRLGVILGRTVSDLVTAVIAVAIASLTGLLIGWRIRGDLADALLAYLIIILFAFAMSWVGAVIGILARSVEVAQGAGLLWLFPITLISTAFVSTAGMPEPLRVLANWNPVSAAAGATRELFGNTVSAGLPPSTGWPGEHPILHVVLSSVVIMAVFVPLAAYLYRRRAGGS